MSSWIHRLETLIQESKELPFLGKSPEFPLKDYESHLNKMFEMPLKISLEKSEWKEKIKPLDFVLTFSAIPLEGEVFLMMSQEDLSTLTSWTLNRKGYFDSEMQKSYFYFLGSHAILALKDTQFFPQLSFHFSDAPFQAKGYCTRLKISFQEESIWAFLVMTPSFTKAFKNYFSERSTPLENYSLSKEIPLKVGIEIGRVSLRASEWKALKAGDCVILDRLSYESKEKKGKGTLVLAGKALLQGKIRNNEFKVSKFMNIDEDYDDEDYEEEEFEEDDDEDEDEDDLEDDDDLDDEDFDEDEDDDDEDDESLDEEDELEDEDEEINDVKKEKKAKSLDVSEEDEKPLSLDNIPLSVKIELGQIKLTISDLIDLKSGSHLDLPFSVEEGVKLTVNGKLIAKGEIVEFEDVKGVRITEINRG